MNQKRSWSSESGQSPSPAGGLTRPDRRRLEAAGGLAGLLPQLLEQGPLFRGEGGDPVGDDSTRLLRRLEQGPQLLGREAVHLAQGLVELPASAAASSASTMRSASSPRSRVSNTICSVTWMPCPCVRRETSWVASSECPPRSKKLSRIPTRSRPSTSAVARASSSSSGVAGGDPLLGRRDGRAQEPAAPRGRPCRWR